MDFSNYGTLQVIMASETIRKMLGILYAKDPTKFLPFLKLRLAGNPQRSKNAFHSLKIVKDLTIFQFVPCEQLVIMATMVNNRFKIYLIGFA